MSGMNNNNNKRSSIALDSQQSLLTAINRFVQAVDTMDDTVMIPCRLRDMPVDSLPNVLEENNNNKAVVPALGMNGDLYHFYAMLHAIRSEITAGPQNSNEEEQCDNASACNDENSNDDPINESARKTAASFRYHLRGLFGLLHQMTETAKYLSTRYEKEVTSAQNGVSSVSSFNM
ncbi:mid1-interacting protein 1A [Aplysia californica]|uniref:Mid1-interacting protein 1A n=1 Tax=Aplysia californica TaxID=6500 RepID=A0ABM1VTY5_APLCA|nr:mid1-interacting protein 1A [Aplysia californica]